MIRIVDVKIFVLQMFPGPHGTVEAPKPTKCQGCKLEFMDQIHVPVPHDLIIAHRQKYLFWNGKTQSKKDVGTRM